MIALAPWGTTALEFGLSHLSSLARLGLLRPFLRQQLISEAVATVQLSAQEREEALERFAREHGLKDEEALEAHRVKHLLSPEALAELIEQPLRLERLCDQKFQAKAEARFLQRKAQLDRVIYSLLRLADGGLARELYLRIEEDEADFAQMAAAYSEGPEKNTRGVVGPVPLTQAHPVLAERLRTATPGVLLEPFQIETWWLVVRLEGVMPASFDEAMARQMSSELFQQWLAEQEQKRLTELSACVSA